MRLPGRRPYSLAGSEGKNRRGDQLVQRRRRRRVASAPPAPSGRSVAANTLASGASDRGCESLRPDHFIAVSSNSRTTGFEPVNGGASPPAAAKRGLGLPSVVVSLAGRNSGGCDSRRLHHFHGSQALTVMPPVLTRQNPEHYRGGPPWLGGAAVSAAPS